MKKAGAGELAKQKAKMIMQRRKVQAHAAAEVQSRAVATVKVNAQQKPPEEAETQLAAGIANGGLPTAFFDAGVPQAAESPAGENIALPTDFFDVAVAPAAAEGDQLATAASAGGAPASGSAGSKLPQGFFDNINADQKAQGIDPEAKLK